MKAKRVSPITHKRRWWLAAPVARHLLTGLAMTFIAGIAALPAYGQSDAAPAAANTKAVTTELSTDIESLKQAALELNRDLLILEEDLLFPASTQIAVFVSVDVGHFFRLDAVKLKIDDQLVASHVYSEKQNSALTRGGIQRLYLGNLKTGSHEITAFFEGVGPHEREYKRGATYQLEKDQTPTMLEIRIMDSSGALQPKFDFKEWDL